MSKLNIFYNFRCCGNVVISQYPSFECTTCGTKQLQTSQQAWGQNMFYQPWDGDDDDTDDKTKAKHNAHHSVMSDPYGKWYNTYKPEISKECMHEWKDYIGLNERFKFCTKCDKKDNQ